MRSDAQLAGAPSIVRRLIRLGVAPTAIAKACQGAPTFHVQRFEANLALLDAHGVDVRPLADALGELLWTAPPDRWRFLLDTLKLRAAADMALFAELLASRAEPCAEVAHALVARHTPVRGLAECQRVMMIEARDPGAQAWALQRDDPVGSLAAAEQCLDLNREHVVLRGSIASVHALAGGLRARLGDEAGAFPHLYDAVLVGRDHGVRSQLASANSARPEAR